MAIKTLVLQNASGSVRVEYKTDLVGDDNNFTVMEIVDMSDAEVALGLDFQQLPNSITAFRAFAEANSLKLSVVSPAASETIIVDYTDESE